ncbi:187-kDa microtubule-associated protein AIR9 [Cucumis melo var. makuwa]|uniref:187-kDa microtubule-associated protein AIR9 n=1 Tax=Cucumis melo var. makuwa TaxID=1194695 RepID=A0A5A7V2Z0_CUCMM|nr:187-kDa microtubule-associated protein AIR9 [Cucumis melo var. makuwa]TYK27440.1 187-kDa microtubule-associated protein AIR9 [Cucumis melo var. makuwa]
MLALTGKAIVAEVGDTKSFELLPTKRSCSYKVRLEDIGHCLRCECIVIDSFGRSTEPTYAETSSVLQGVPKIDKLEIEDFWHNLLQKAMMSLDQVSIEDFIGKEGKCQEVRPTYGTKHQTLLPPLNNGTKSWVLIVAMQSNAQQRRG